MKAVPVRKYCLCVKQIQQQSALLAEYSISNAKDEKVTLNSFKEPFPSGPLCLFLKIGKKNRTCWGDLYFTLSEMWWQWL